ncbi:SusC/RagA family TonB-linked outer membrane protein [Panacibacter ginsenosidivorans]|nr:SusC/RagA family TonB-linked outer membrane protein [Panacibacter ginsenosidivorans]
MAQTTTISGRLTDALTGEPVSGATLTLQSTGKTATSNAAGAFTIQLAGQQDTVIISCIGYAAQKIAVTGSSPALLLALQPAGHELAAVTVSTGYETLPKERATGSFAGVDSALYNSRISTGIITRLEGITSGLVFNRGIPGRTTELSIRGQSTLFANASPLIVVDNFPFEGDISALNPNDIESITVLKDAAAASIWGVRAGNGVIVITTKKAALNRPLQIGLTANLSIGAKPDLWYDPRFLPTAPFMEVEQMLFTNGFYNTDFTSSRQPPVSPFVDLLHRQQTGELTAAEAGAGIEALKGNDLRNELSNNMYRHTINNQYLLSMQGGTEKAAYYISVGYDDNKSMAVGNSDKRVTLHTQLQLVPLRNLEITTGIDYNSSNSYTDNTIPRLSMGGPAGKNLYPYATLTDGQGNASAIVKDYATAFVEQAPAHGLLNWQFLPVEELRNGYNTGKIQLNQTRLLAALKYNLPKGFSAELRYQLEKGITTGSNTATAASYDARNLVNTFAQVTDGNATGFVLPKGGVLDQFNAMLTAHNGRGQLSYKYRSGYHELAALAGMEWRQVISTSNSNRLYGYSAELGTFQQVDPTTYYTTYPSGQSEQLSLNQSLVAVTDRFRSAFANAAYTYKQRYMVSLSGRRDGSNYFGVATNNKTVPLWSAGIKWDLDKQPFYKLAWLPILRLRLTYGYNGNLNKSVTAYPTARYSSNDPYTGLPYLTIINPPNKDLRWEQTAMFNAGIDFGLANNRLTGSIEYYHKKGTDIIGDAALPPSSGYINQNTFSNTTKGNFADLKGSGIDVQLNSINITGAFTWGTQLLFSYTQDEVTHYAAKNPVGFLVNYGNGANGFIIPQQGKPVYGMYSLPWAGLDAAGNPQGYEDGVVSVNYSTLNNPQSIDDLVYNGPARPAFFGGFSNNFSYKQFSLQVNISFKGGYYFRRSSINYTSLFNYYQGNADYLLRWQKPGDENSTSVPSMVYPAVSGRDQFYTNSAVLVERADHIRLQDITLSYTITRNKVKKLPFRSIRLYAYANNLGLLWKANDKGLDPDYPTGIPPVRMYAFGLKADL